MRNKTPTQTEVIVESWENLDFESVGRHELETIGDLLRKKFGATALSPATIARVLADHGAPLSHPDVLDTDTDWREQQLGRILGGDLETINAALVTIENIRAVMSTSNDIDQLRLQVRQVQEELELIAKSEIGGAQKRALAAELASWLTVLLQNPAVFDDWLALRRESPDFLKKFG